MNVALLDNKTDNFDALCRLVANLNRWRDPIESALYHADDTHSFDDIVADILANKMLFFCTDKAFAVMERVQYPQYANLRCFLAGGDLEELLSKTEDMKAIGAAWNCRYLTISGRRGWSRVLEKRGWTHTCTTMSTPIAGEG